MSFTSVPDRDDPSTVHLAGELDLASASAFDEALRELADGLSSVELVLADLTFLDSTGITAMVRLHHQLVERGGGLVLRAPQRQVRRVLEVTGLDQVFVIRDT